MNTSLTDVISKSAKYKTVSSEVVGQVIDEFVGTKNKDKELEKRVKNLLHQAWGAFYPIRPNFTKLKDKLKEGFASGVDEKDLLIPVLRIHSSTNERLLILVDFYKEIFNVTGIPTSIPDLGCGLSPLTLPWMGLPADCKYTAIDIDVAQMDFICDVTKLLNWEMNLSCLAGNALSGSFDRADVVFMFRLIPVLEKLTRKFDLKEFIDKFDCNYFVITFPLGSLSGKKVGMYNFYNSKMLEFFNKSPREYKVIKFPNELVYIIKNSV